ncbi:hypothetical protein [Microbispora rosea]|uniref:hypothetical protein n=1 Tax=Microbispora rosea TaxID=58117 RepID=UPI003D9064E7
MHGSPRFDLLRHLILLQLRSFGATTDYGIEPLTGRTRGQCVRPGQRSRLVHRAIAYHGRKGKKKGFGIPEFQALVRSAHHLLGGPIVVVRDNLSTHAGPTMRTFIDVHADWLTAFRLPAYAPSSTRLRECGPT